MLKEISERLKDLSADDLKKVKKIAIDKSYGGEKGKKGK